MAFIKSKIRKHDKQSDGVLIIDDEIFPCYVYISLPVGYEIVHKDIVFYDIASKKVKKKASLTKNEHFHNLIKQSYNNKVLFDYVLADNWFGAKDNLEYIHNLQKYFIIGIKSNRTIALVLNEKIKRQFQQVWSLNLQDGQFIKG